MQEFKQCSCWLVFHVNFETRQKHIYGIFHTPGFPLTSCPPPPPPPPMSFSFAQSGQMMSSPSVMNPFPAIDTLHRAQTKQWECQWRPSKLMNLDWEECINMFFSPSRKMFQARFQVLRQEKSF